MNRLIGFKLFLMMVLEFFIWGCWLPLIYGYLPSLHFTPVEQSWILNTFPIAAIIGMFFSNQYADRHFAAEKFLGLQPSRGRSGHSAAGLHPVLLALLRADAPALPALRADAFHRQFDRLRQHEGPAKGVRPGARGRRHRLDSRRLALHFHPGGLGQGPRRPPAGPRCIGSAPCSVPG